MAHDRLMQEQAVAWAVRTGDPAFDEWDSFTDWLESDPAHAEAYDRIMAGVEDASQALPPPAEAANDAGAAMPLRSRGWFAGLVGIAAAGLAVFGAWTLRDQTYSVETPAGTMRMVELEAGGQVTLSGGTSVTFDRSDPGVVVLNQGQALFSVTHDEDRPFRVEVGGNRLVDVGTVFDVRYTGRSTRVAVSEGAVQFNPDAQNVRVAPGQVLSFEGAGASYRLEPVAASQVGEWREGRLTFQNELLIDVAADLSRVSGQRFETAPASAGLRVSGSVLVDPIRDDPQSLGPLLGVAVRSDGDKWMIGAR